MITAEQPMSVEVVAVMRVLARKRQAERPPPPFLEFLDHVYIQPDMDREDYDPDVEFSPRGGLKWQKWPYLVERAESWAARNSESIVKARQLGISWLAAAYALWRSMYHPYTHGAVFSAGQREARVQLARSRFIYDNLPAALRRGGEKPFNANEAAFTPSGSVIVAFPSTEHTGISYTFRYVIRDEAAFHPYGAANYAAVRPTLSAGGQFIDMSTANPELGPSGDFHDRYWASKRGETPYTAVFIPWYARPGRDAAWLARERAAYQGMLEEFDAYYPDSDTAAFVARSGLVFPQFSDVRHVRPAVAGLVDCVRVVAGVDFGGGDPTAVVVLGLDKRHHVHQYAEFYKRGAVSLDEIGDFLKRFPVGSVVCDPSQGVAIETLRHMYKLPARPANNKRGEGLGMVAYLLDHGRLTIDPSCVDSLAEFPGYRWATKVDPNDKTRFATTTPVDHHADAMDARRYAVLEITAMLHEDTGPRVQTFTGRPPARKAA